MKRLFILFLTLLISTACFAEWPFVYFNQDTVYVNGHGYPVKIVDFEASSISDGTISPDSIYARAGYIKTLYGDTVTVFHRLYYMETAMGDSSFALEMNNADTLWLNPGGKWAQKITQFNTGTFKWGIDTTGHLMDWSAGVFSFGGATTDTVSFTGNVGINVTDPVTDLEIVPASNGGGINIANTGNTATAIELQSWIAAPKIYLIPSGVPANGVLLDGGGTSYLNGGNVGIGTTTPKHKLDIETGGAENGIAITNSTTDSLWLAPDSVNFNGQVVMDNAGDITLTQNMYMKNSKAIYFNRAGDDIAYAVLSAQGDNEVRFTAISGNNFEWVDSGGNPLMILTDEGTTGNLGIGTTTPDYPVEISSTSNQLELEHTAGADSALIYVNEDGDLFLSPSGLDVRVSTRLLTGNGVAGSPSHSFTSDANSGMYSATNDTLRISTGGSDRLTIDASGNVGIGTASPGDVLEVNGDIKLSGQNYLYYNGVTDQSIRLASSSVNLNSRGNLNLNVDSNNNDVSAGVVIVGNGSNGAGDTIMVIRHDGNVGIGTTTPKHKLDIETGGAENGIAITNSTTDSLWLAPDSVNFNGQVVMDNAGNVGIGTASPNEALEVSGNIRLTTDTDDLYFGASDYISKNYIRTGSGAGYTINSVAGGSSIKFMTENTQVAVIDSNGNVGIGTTDPDAALHILNATGPQFIITDTDNADSTTFEVDGDGDLTIIPSGGDVNITGDVTIDGALNFSAGNTVWDSYPIDITIPKLPAGAPASLSTYQEFPVLDFAHAADDNAYITWHIPKQYSAEDSVCFHFDVMLPGACTTDSLVAFALEYKLVTDGDVFNFAAGTTTILDSLTFNSTSAYETKTMNLCLTTTGWEAEKSVLMRFYRDVDGCNHNYEDVARVWGIHVDYKSFGIGE